MEDNKGTPAPEDNTPHLVKYNGERWHIKDGHNSAQFHLNDPGQRYNYAKVDTSQNNSTQPNDL